MTIGETLRELREKRGLKQETVAKDIGIKRESLSQYENGVHIPKLPILKKLADYYDTTIDFLMR